MDFIFWFAVALICVFTLALILKLTYSVKMKNKQQFEIIQSKNNVKSVGLTTEISEEPRKLLLSAEEKVVPLSVNYHFTRKCNYNCGFCFHTAKSSFVLPLDTAKKGLSMLRDAGNKFAFPDV